MRVWRQVWAALRGIVAELSDENAYRRHLEHHGCVDTPEEYRRFQREHFGRKYQRAKCC